MTAYLAGAATSTDPVATDALTFDWHLHTVASDGRATALEMEAMARSLGRRIGTSEHVLMDNARLRTVDQLRAHARSVRDLGLPVGAEISVGDPSAAARVAFDAGALNDFDYVIASLHQVDVPQGRVQSDRYLNWRYGLFARYVPNIANLDRQAYFDRWLVALDDTLRRVPVTILGHFALAPELARHSGDVAAATDPSRDPEPDAEASAWLDATIDLCLAHNVAIELNSKSRVPHADFIARALERGARFTLGSDAHSLDRAGDVGFGLAMARMHAIPRDRFLPPPAAH
jgi:histidinol phosphatase-like PHP family hydrolase